MSDSESDASPSIPSDPKLEQCLRQVISRFFKSSKQDELTVRRVRTEAEQELKLSKAFFKSDAKWKDKSQEIIGDEVSKQEIRQEEPSSPEEKPKPQKRAPTKANGAQTAKRGTKRPSPDSKPPPTKKLKLAVPDAEESELSSVRDVESESQAENKPAKPTTDEADEKEPEEKPAEAPAKVTEKDADGSSSELSSLIDEPPPPKKKRQKADSKTKKSVKEKSKPTEPSKAPKTSKAKDTSDVPPQEAEIKRLQSWLIKCGIRKMWHRELAPCSTENAKISHLKQMLKDAGMDGRYSVEKARQIKEKRELAADLEAVQEGNKMWGQGSGDEEEGKDSEGGEVEEPAPKRRLAKGLQDLAAFDDEESD